MPRGDLEFWALRRGARLKRAPSRTLPVTPEAGARIALRRVAAAAWLGIVLGLSMQAMILLVRKAGGEQPALVQVAADMAQGVTWAFFVCAGVGLGTALARVHVSIGGLIGLVCAPMAVGLAKGSQKFMNSALGASDKPALLPLSTLGVMRAVEYGVLAWLLASLVAADEVGFRRFLRAGIIVGGLFGGTILFLSMQAAASSGIALPNFRIAAIAINEIVFPIGCAVVVFIALKVGKHIKLVAPATGK